MGFEVEYITQQPLPEDLGGRSLRRRWKQIAALFVAIGVIAAFAPGLSELRDRLAQASPGWLVTGLALELFSCLSYVLVFKPVFCPRMSWRTSYELGMSELAVGSLVPSGGAAGLAFGAWALRRGGMPADDIARRSVAFFLLTSAVNFAAVTLAGIAMWLGVGPHRSPLLTVLPASLALSAIAAIVAVARFIGRRAPATRERAASRYRNALVAVPEGIVEAGVVLRRGDWRVVAGSLGYWAFDNAVLWATLRAFGESAPITVVLMAYLLGQLGGLIPIPGGLGGIDVGLLGAMVVYGLPAGAAAAGLLGYRVILFWLPLLIGGSAFVSLRKGLSDPDRPDICDPFERVVPLGS